MSVILRTLLQSTLPLLVGLTWIPFVSAWGDELLTETLFLRSSAEIQSFLADARPESEAGRRFLEEFQSWVNSKNQLGDQVMAGLTLAPLVAGNPHNVSYFGRELIGVMKADDAGVVKYGARVFEAGFHLPTPSIACHSNGENLDGLSGVLAALHSSMDKLGLLDRRAHTDVAGNFTPEILREAKSATGCPGMAGTTDGEHDRIYQHFAEKAGASVRCGRLVTARNGTTDELLLVVNEALKAGGDCRLVTTNRLGSRHSMHINKLTADARYWPFPFLVETYDTGEQGDGNGQGVPSTPITQELAFQNSGSDLDTPSIRDHGVDGEFWTQYFEGVRKIQFKCCFVEK